MYFPSGISSSSDENHRRTLVGSDEQMSMPKPVCPNMATTTPLGPPGASDWPQTARKQDAGFAQAGRATIRHLPLVTGQVTSTSVHMAEPGSG